MVGASGSSSSLSFSKPEVLVGSKLSAAQTELQACEQHLAMKERELENLRSSAIKTGLEARCKALVECGWTWGEMGKEGLRALESGAEITHGHHGMWSFCSYSRRSKTFQIEHRECLSGVVSRVSSRHFSLCRSY